MPAEDALETMIRQLDDVRRRVANLERLETSSYTAHAPVTLDANSVQVNSLTAQELGLQVQAHNFAWIGPVSGAPAVPTFRALDPADMPGILPTRGLCFADQWNASTAQTVAVSTGQLHNMIVYQTTPANGNTFSFSLPLQAGTYSIVVLGYTDANRGILDIYADGVEVGSKDWFAAAPGAQNVYHVITPVTLTGNILHTFDGVIHGKNALSSGYAYVLTTFAVYQTTD